MRGRNLWIMNHYATNMFFDKGGRHYWFAENLIKKDYEPTIFCANTDHDSGKAIPIPSGKYIRMTVEKIPFVFVKTTGYAGNGLERIRNMLWFSWNLYTTAKTYAKEFGKPDLILASSVHPLTLVAGIKLARRFCVPCICEIRDLWPEAIFALDSVKETSVLGRVLTAGEYWIYRQADALIFTKEGDTDYLKEKGWDAEQGGKLDLSKAYYINNGVDIEAFDKSSKINVLADADLDKDKFNVTYVGAIRPINDVGKIIDAAAILKNRDDIQFLIYGDGSEKRVLEKRLKDEELANVRIKGYVNKQLVPFILSRSSVNILNYSPGQYNWARGNSSNKLFEYMASGKPVISTVKTGYSIIEKYRCGLELEHGSAEELAGAILKVKGMSGREYHELGQNARTAAKEFDVKVHAERLIEVFEFVAGGDESW